VAVSHKRSRAAFDEFWLGHISETIADAIRQASKKASTGKPIRGTPKGEQCDALLPLAIELSS